MAAMLRVSFSHLRYQSLWKNNRTICSKEESIFETGTKGSIQQILDNEKRFCGEELNMLLSPVLHEAFENRFIPLTKTE